MFFELCGCEAGVDVNGNKINVLRFVFVVDFLEVGLGIIGNGAVVRDEYYHSCSFSSERNLFAFNERNLWGDCESCDDCGEH